MDEQTRNFLEQMLPRMTEADTALHDGDPSERRAMWSTHAPVTLFGAAFTATSPAEINQAFSTLGRKFSDCRSFAIEVLAAGVAGDLAYIAAIERTTAAVDGNDPTAYALRVTTVFRREDDSWNVVHRHGDPYDDSAGGVAEQLKR